MIQNKKERVGGRRRVRGATRNHARGCVSLFPFFLTCQTHKAGEGDQGQRDGGGARVRRKENKDRTQSNQQQLNA